MRIRSVYLGAALLAGALLVWSCANESGGAKQSPCSYDNECASGLICAVGRCSNRSAGSPCDEDNECAGVLVCNNAVCGGTIGETCASDMFCIQGLICATITEKEPDGTVRSTPRCAQSNGEPNAACRLPGHCNSGVCSTRGLCNEFGSIGSPCAADNQCDSEAGQVCIGGACNNKSTQDGACNNDDHCLEALVCGTDSTCGKPEEAMCSVGECIAGFICADGKCVVPSSGSTGSVCGSDSHCADGFICAGDPVRCVMPGLDAGRVGSVCRQGGGHCDMGLSCVLGECSDGSIGSSCNANSDCTDLLICGDHICGLRAGSSCTDDDQCADPFVCTGPAGNRMCSLSNGNLRDACGIDTHCTGSLCIIGICSNTRGVGGACTLDDHCTGDLACGSRGVCGVASGDACSADGDCVGSLVCQSQVCAELDSGIGGACRSDDQCTGADVICVVESGNQVCRQSDGDIGSVCATSGHCIDDFLCSSDSTVRTCQAAPGTTCTDDDDCADGLACQAQVCTQLSSGDGGACRSAGGCGEGLICAIVTGSQICTSTDGMAGSACAIDTHCGDALICHNNLCTVPTAVWVSAVSNVSGKLNDVHYGGALLVAVGSGTDSMGNAVGAITTSSDYGVTWVSRVSGVTSELNAVHYADGLWVAVGAGGVVTTSSNGETWASLRSNVTSELNAVHYANSMWVAVGARGTVAVSSDGSTWGGATSNVSGTLNAVHHDGTLWAAVGAGGAITTSTNGIAWADKTPTGVSVALVDVHSAAVTSGVRWAAIDGGGDAVITSTDGSTWTQQTIAEASALTDIHRANGIWVAAGTITGDTSSNGGVVTSAIDSTWDSHASDANDVLNAVHYADSLWVAVGAGGAIITSTGGTTWTDRTSVSGVTSELTDIYYAAAADGTNGRWVAVGAGGVILTSRTR